MKTLEEFKKARNEALLSLDEVKIRKFFRDFNSQPLPTNPVVFWGAVHKAITGCTDLPFEFRQKSKAYLTNAGFTSHDDGDLAAPV